ncbi:MAG: carboxypeptidase M32 [Bdellovibrionales bacterium]|nr:carboxypeptidase M32 [Bdellovibrionales bacterium]
MLASFYQTLEELYLLTKTSYLLGWDQQVCMPKGGAELRGKKLAYLAKLRHEKITDSAFVNLVHELSEQPLAGRDAINVREIKRDIEKLTKLPKELVSQKTYASSVAMTAWEQARAENNFAAVLPHLEKLVGLARQEIDCLGYVDNPYDALIDYYEPQTTIKDIKPLLLRLAEKLEPVIAQALERSESMQPITGVFPIEKQVSLSKCMLEKLGYSWQRGRLDTVTHPFECNIGFQDVRITTRYTEEDYLSSIMTALHEMGHAFYELGFDPETEGTPMGEAISMSIHESQSLFWEGIVGRRKSFCEFLASLAKDYFPKDCKAEDIWNHINRVERSLIRVEADRVTYSLHIVIRMLLEEQLLNAQLEVKELPDAWNALYEKHLGLRPESNRLGVLQDVHWYSGSFGYFPSYALGHLYAAMFFESFEDEMGPVDDFISRGDFLGITKWLNENIHVHGKTYTPQALVKKVTGKELTEDSFVNYLVAQYS